MKKLLITTALGLCTLPALAAGSLANTQAASAGAKPAAASSSGLPGLPPLQVTETVTMAPGGTGYKPDLQPVALPGLGSVSTAYSNPGQGASDQAQSSVQLNINPSNSSQAPTTLASSVNDPHGQASVDNKLTTQGSGSASNPNLSASSIPLVGTVTPSYNNKGQGKSLEASLDYQAPAPQPLPGASK